MHTVHDNINIMHIPIHMLLPANHHYSLYNIISIAMFVNAKQQNIVKQTKQQSFDKNKNHYTLLQPSSTQVSIEYNYYYEHCSDLLGN